MAGVTAGRLNIEIVAEIARLQSDLDKAKRAVKAASGDIAASARHANDNLAGMASGLGKAGGQSKVATHHLANLSFQLQDLFIGLKSGQKPMTVFLQQGGQIAQIMGQAGIGVGGLAKAVGGMAANFARAHPILAAIGVAAGAGAAGLSVLTEQVNAQHKGELDAYAASLGLTAEEIEKAGGAAVTSGDMIAGLWDVIREALGLESIFASLKGWFIDTFTAAAMNAKKNVSEIYAAIAAAVDGIRAVWGNVGPIIGNAVISGANTAIAAVEKLINLTLAAFRSLASQLQPLLEPLGMSIESVFNPVNLGRIADPFAGAGASAADAFSSAYKRRLGEAEGAFDSFMERWGEAGVERRNKRLLSKVEDEAEKAGKAAGKKAAENFGRSFAEAFKEFAEYGKRIQEAANDNAKLRETLAGLQQEAKLVGLVGWERERLLTILEHEAQIRPLLERIKQAELAGEISLAATLREQLDLLNKIFRQRLENGDAADDFAKAKDAADAFNDSLQDIISSLEGIGGLGGVLGGLLGVLTGNRVSGPIGDLLNIAVDVDPITKEVRKLGDVLRGAIGNLGGQLAGVLQFAGAGIMGGTAIFGKQGTTGQIASGLGGAALGMLVGGPLGAILGGVAGAGLAKLLAGSSRGAAIFGPGGVTGTYGDTSKFKDEASGIADGILDTLQRIADQFGSDLNTGIAKVSIGIRDGKYIVDPQGRGYTKTSKYKDLVSFGTDAEAAAEYALKLMLDRGAITMREGSLKIVKAATDLEEGLRKALMFEEIMDMLEGGSSQLVSQVKALRTQFGEYIEVMKEAGASVADLTRVQEMQAERIKALVAQAGESYRSTFFTDAQNLAFARQQIAAVLNSLGKGWIDTVAEYMTEVEKAQLDTSDAGLAWLDTLYGLADQFGVIKSAADEAAAAAAAQAAADKAAREAAAEAARQERQRQIDAAKDALRSAYEREADQLRQTIDRFAAFAETLRDFRRELIAGEGQADSYAARLAELRRVGGLAALGNEQALGALPGVGRDFLAAAKDRAGSMIEYQRAVAMVARYAGSAETAAQGMVTEAEKQLAALDKQVGKLIDIDEKMLTVSQAMQELVRLQGGSMPGSTSAGGSTSRGVTDRERPPGGRGALDRLLSRVGNDNSQSARDERERERADRFDRRLAAQEDHGRRMAQATEAMNTLLQSMTRDGSSLVIATDPDTPIGTVAA